MIPILNVRATDDRYARQEHVFPEARRRNARVAVLVGRADPMLATWMLVGMAAAGLPCIGADGAPHSRFRGRWSGDFRQMAKMINDDVTYRYVDPCAPASDVAALLDRAGERWIVLQLNDAGWRRTVGALLAGGIHARLLLILTGPGGFVVYGCADLEQAVPFTDQIGGILPSDTVIPAGTPEVAMAAAGIALTEVMLAPLSTGHPAPPELVAFYSLARMRRTDTPERLADQITEVVTPAGAPITFKNRRLEVVGAGGLGNPVCCSLALDSPRLRIWDGDPAVERHNLNRQFLLLDGPRSGLPKAVVLANALQQLDAHGSYEGRVRYVSQKQDLCWGKQERPDALIALPDNDDARWLCGDIAWDTGVVCAAAGSSALGAQINVATPPTSACMRCQTQHQSIRGAAGQSCALVANDSIVGTNFVAAGLLVSELRQALAGAPTCNVRLAGDARGGNRLTRMLSNPLCPHRTDAGRAPESSVAGAHV